MQHKKITNFLNKTGPKDIARFTIKKWVEIFDFSNGTYNPSKDFRFKTFQLRNDLCDFSNASIVVTDKIIVTNPNNFVAQYNRKVALKNSAPFFNCILKINSQLIGDAQYLDIVMLMYNLLYYLKNFRKTTGSFWNYYPDMPSSGYNNNNRDRIFYSIRNSESFDYKAKLVGTLPGAADVANNDVETELEDTKTVGPLKDLSNFMFNLDFLLTNAQIEFILKWSQDCVLSGKATREEIAKGDGPATEPAVDAIDRPKDLKSSITNCKMYVPVVTLQEKYENKLYEELKTGITIDFTWSKYRTQVINQTATNNLNYLIDPTFNNVNRLFVLAFSNEEDRSIYFKYYTPTIEIKDYNVILDGKTPFYDIPIKNKEETYKPITKLIKNGDYAAGDSLNFKY